LRGKGKCATMEDFLKNILRGVGLLFALYSAYEIRLGAVRVYGKVIHEFDPWFNYRATEYLVRNGAEKFFTWYDEESWYPLGRPVGTTIYPGLQFTAAYIYYGVNAIGWDMSLNDVCVYVPAVFGPLSTLFVFLLAYETNNQSVTSGVFAALFMAVAPAHLMRSVAGGFDNESIAVCAICGTFYFWIRSLRGEGSWVWSIATSLMYIYMVGAWGGYTFVLNMVGVHAAILILMGRFTPNLHKAYTLWYVVGTLGAIQFPVVGYAPLKSLEQLGPMAVLLWLQLMLVCWHYKKRMGDMINDRQYQEFMFMLFAGAALFAVLVLIFVLPRGFLGPVSARIRGLFVQHTRTGNPLVDSVAEHQATRDEMYYQYFHMMCYLLPVGFVSLFFSPSNSKLFMISYTLISGYFSRKMIRLVLILGPSACVVAGIAFELILTWSMEQLSISDDEEEEDSGKGKKDGKKGGKGGGKASRAVKDFSFFKDAKKFYDDNLLLRKGMGVLFLGLLVTNSFSYWNHSWAMSDNLSNPSIMVLGRGPSGEPVMIDDFREAYWWLRDNTPEDARVMSWWDYGYQINGIANRTTIADGNTWNHEHIALLGRALVSPVKKSHRIVRHLADYVLVWSTQYGGMWGDDIAKSPHMARIGGSVYKEINPDEFYQDEKGNPSDMMRKSLIYTLVHYRLNPAVPALKADTFEEVYTSKNRMVRIYKVLKVSKKSKKYCKEGRGYQAWFEGRPLVSAYPPGLQEILAGKEDYEQLEDFNKGWKEK